MYKISILVLLLCMLLASCKRCVLEDCNGYETISLHYIHYSVTEANSILIKKYKQQTNYTEIVDSIEAEDYNYSGDTVIVQFVDRQANTLEELNVEYDLEIINPFDNKIVRISDIIREHATQEVCSGGLFNNKKNAMQCNNNLLSYNYSVNMGTIEVIGNNIFVPK